jgi:hypothetical protein
MTKEERDYQAPITHLAECWHLSRGLSPLAELKTLRSHDLSKNRDQHFVPRHFATLIPALKALPACNKFGSHGHQTEPLSSLQLERATARLLTSPSTSHANESIY